MPTVLMRIQKVNYIVRWLEQEILTTGGATAYDTVRWQVKADETLLHDVSLAQLDTMPPDVRAAHLPHCLLGYRAELWDLHRTVNAAPSRVEASRLLSSPWSPRPRHGQALANVVDIPLLYRRISPGGVMTILGQKYTERY